MASIPVFPNPKLDYEDINDLQISDSVPLGYEDYEFISQSRYDGGSISLLQGDEIISIGPNRYSLNSSSPYPNLFQSEYEGYLSTTWIDLDGNVALIDSNGNPIPTGPGMQGNQAGDDLIIGFNRVSYSDRSDPYGNFGDSLAIARLRDEQGEYFIVQDRSGNSDNQGTDTLRRVNTLEIDSDYNGIRDWDLTGEGIGEYYFSEQNYNNKDIWIDLDGNVALIDSNGNPIPTGPGMQGNQAGDDLIIGFNRVSYSDRSDPYGNFGDSLAIARLRDEQGEYFIVQDRSGNSDNQGTDTLRRVNTLEIDSDYNGIRDWDLTGEGIGEYYFSEQNYNNKDIWIDLDGNVALIDSNGNPIPTGPGMQGNQAGDDLIIGFNRVSYSDRSDPYGNFGDSLAIARLRDEQGEYFIVQDRSGNSDNQGTDTLRRVNTLEIDSDYNGIRDWDLTGEGIGEYYFSEQNYNNKDIWIDLDGNVALIDSNGNPIPTGPGMQGNQAGDDLIIGFNRVSYSDRSDPYGNFGDSLAIARLRDEQGEYFIVQDRSGNSDNQGTDTLRRVNTLEIDSDYNGIRDWDLTGEGIGEYYFSEQNYNNKDIWIDLDGNVALIDSNGNPIPTGPGMQGNQAGDDLIIGFNRVSYSDRSDPYGNFGDSLAIARLRDEQGEYFIVQDRSGNSDNQGTDTLRRVNTLEIDSDYNGIRDWDLTGEGIGEYYFSEQNYNNKDIWIDLDGNVALIDSNGNPIPTGPGMQGNQAGDDLIIGFNRVSYSDRSDPYGNFGDSLAIARLRDEQGEYFIVQDRSGNSDNQGTDTLRRVNTLEIDSDYNGIRDWDLTGEGIGEYYFSEQNYNNKDIWIDLDGNVALIDSNGNPIPTGPGMQGNQAGDDLIIGFNRVSYSDRSDPYGNFGDSLAIARLRDEQGEYFIVQDRSGNSDNQGTDTLRRVNTLEIDSDYNGIRDWDLTGEGIGEYYFSEQNYNNKDIWIDLDGNVALIDSNGNPIPTGPGMQGNQAGDDLIIGFNRVSYSDRSDPYGNFGDSLAIARLRDEQGEYFIVQDRSGNSDNQGTDTLRRVNTLEIDSDYNGIRDWDLTGEGIGEYYFSEQNYNNKDIWIDLDGNVALIDSNGNPIPTGPGMQGNQAGDDLIIGFNRVSYSDRSDPYGNFGDSLAIARLRDEQGEYFIVQDRSGNSDNQGTDTLRRVNTLEIDSDYNGIRDWDLTGEGIGEYYFSEQNYNNKDIWIDLDGNVALIDSNGNPIPTGPGMQGNQAGDDLIIGFNRVSYSDRSDPYGNFGDSLAIARLRDEQGEYFIVQDRSGNSDNQGTDTLRRVNTLEIDSDYNGIRDWDLTGEGIGEYYFSEQNYNNKDIWIDLDGNVALIDSNGNPIPTGPGMQGNQAGDDLIIGFEELKLDGVMSDYRITKARDTDGYFYEVESNNFSYGSDTLRDVGSIVFDDSVYLFDESIDPGDRALHLQALLTSDSLILPQAAVLGDSVDHNSNYSLLITGESLKNGYTIESADITLHFDPLLFGEINTSDVRIGGDLPIANAVEIDNQAGTVRLAAASLAALNAGDGVSSETVLASINLDFDEVALSTIEKNADGSLVTNPLTFSLSANADETVFSKDFFDGTGLLNREIVTLNDLGGYVAVDSQDVTLYEAKINFEQQGDGLVLGTQRVIGADATFTNLIRSGDTLTTSVDWLNVGNIQANNLSYSEVYNQNATLNSADFSQTSVASGSFIDGVFVEDAREDTTLTADIKVTGQAGNVLDLSDGIVSIQADGSETFTNQGKGSSNLITFKGDLNYDGRVSMKDLAYLNAGAARQELVDSTDEIGNAVQVASQASYARDVDADFSGKIDLADLSVLDADWGKTLHTGDQGFHGSGDVSWSELDSQGDNSTWDNTSFKDQNAIEAEQSYVGSLESPVAAGVIGADGNTTANDNDITGSEFQDPLSV